MTVRVEVTCVKKSNRMSPHEHIESIGACDNSSGKRWTFSQQEVIDGIESGQWEFYVKSGMKTVKVIVVRTAGGHKYIKTDADGILSNNLLSLPDCPQGLLQFLINKLSN